MLSIAIRPLARRLRTGTAGALLVAFGLGTAQAAEPGELDPADLVMHVGMVNAQKGSPGLIGRALASSARAVFEDINARGGVHGRQLVLHLEDDDYESAQTVDRTLKLIQETRVVALIGYLGLANARAALPLLEEFGVPVVGVFSGGRSLRQPVPSQMFHVRASHAEETEALVGRLVRDGASRVSVLFQNDSLGFDVLRGVKEAVERRGLHLAASASYQRGTYALQEPVAAIVADRPDAVIVAAPQGVTLEVMRAARYAGLQSRFASISMVGTDGTDLAPLKESGEQLLISQVVPMLAEEAPELAAECRRVLRQYTDAPFTSVSFEGCINARTLVKALQLAGFRPTRESIRASLESMRGFDLDGMRLSFSAADHQARSRVYLTEVKDGQLISAR